MTTNNVDNTCRKTKPTGFEMRSIHQNSVLLSKLDWRTACVVQTPNKSSTSLAAIFKQPGNQEQYAELNRALRYVDTIRLRFTRWLDIMRLRGVLFRSEKEIKPGVIVKIYYGSITLPNGAKVSIMYQPWNRERQYYVSFTLSVPKVIQGNNYENIPEGFDILGELQKILAVVFSTLRMPQMSLANGEIMQLDSSFNFFVGPHVGDYIEYVSRQYYPNRDRSVFKNRPRRKQDDDYKNNGVCFYSDAARTNVYAKGPESGVPEGDGILRLENSQRKASAVRRLMKKKHPLLIDLSAELCRRLLLEDMAILGLDHPILAVQNWIAKLAKFTPHRRMTLMGFMRYEAEHPGKSAEELATIIGYTKQAVNGFRKDLKKAGISYWENTMNLPALSLDGVSENASPLPSDASVLSNGNSECEKISKDSCNTSQDVEPPNTPISLVPNSEVTTGGDGLFISEVTTSQGMVSEPNNSEASRNSPDSLPIRRKTRRVDAEPIELVYVGTDGIKASFARIFENALEAKSPEGENAFLNYVLRAISDR